MGSASRLHPSTTTICFWVYSDINSCTLSAQIHSSVWAPFPPHEQSCLPGCSLRQADAGVQAQRNRYQAPKGCDHLPIASSKCTQSSQGVCEPSHTKGEFSEKEWWAWAYWSTNIIALRKQNHKCLIKFWYVLYSYIHIITIKERKDVRVHNSFPGL